MRRQSFGHPQALPDLLWSATFGAVRLGPDSMPEPFGSQCGKCRVDFDAGELPSEGEG